MARKLETSTRKEPGGGGAGEGKKKERGREEKERERALLLQCPYSYECLRELLNLVYFPHL